MVQRKHWVALYDTVHFFTLLATCTVSQFFGNATAKGMQWYREKKNVSLLHDSQASQKFIERIDRLAHAMNSGGSKGAQDINRDIYFPDDC